MKDVNQTLAIRLGIVAVIVGAIIRSLKTDAFNSVLAKFGLKSLPKTVLPWLALVLGVVLATIDGKIQGLSWIDAALNGVLGLVSGGAAVVGNETLVEGAKAMMTKPANDNSTVVEEKKAS